MSNGLPDLLAIGRGAIVAPAGCGKTELLSRALAENRYNQRATAEALGLSYDQLRHALKRHELLNAGG